MVGITCEKGGQLDLLIYTICYMQNLTLIGFVAKASSTAESEAEYLFHSHPTSSTLSFEIAHF